MSLTTPYYKNPLKRNGTAQFERLIAALSPDNFKLDNRSLKDIMVASYRYASLLQYPDESGQINGDWSCFWEAETLTFLAVLSTIDTDEIAKEFAEIEKNTEGESGKNTPSYLAAIEYIRKTALMIETHYQKLPDGIPIKKEMEAIIRKNRLTDAEQLEGALSKLIGWHKDVLNPDVLDSCEYEVFIGSPNWGIPNPIAFSDIEFDNAYSKDDWQSLKQLTYEFQQALVRIKKRACYWFDKNLETPQLRQPHIALFLTFLRLFQHTRDEMNGLTKRHLDFYYEKVLHLRRNPSKPDDVYLIFQLANTIDQHLIGAGTEFLAGKKDGKSLLFETIEDWVLSGATVEEIKNTYLGKKDGLPYIFASPDVKVAYKGGIVDENAPVDCFRAFGDDKNLPEGEIGFAISSPQLILREGKRFIEVALSTQHTGNVLTKLIPKYFKLFLSTEKEWLALDYSNSEVSERTTNSSYSVNLFQRKDSTSRRTIVFSIFLKEDISPIEALGDEFKNKSSIDTNWPVLKIIYKTLANGQEPESTTPFYEELNKLNIQEVNIDVSVKGVKENLIVQNDSGVFDGKQEFLPWGPTPRKGNHFYIGNTEAFQKKIKEASIHFDWIDPPNFFTHYINYVGQKSIAPCVLIDNQNGGSIPDKIQNNYPLENTDIGVVMMVRSLEDESVGSVSLLEEDKLNIKYSIPINLTFPERDVREQTFTEYSPTLKRGFLRVALHNDTFLHERYQESLVLQSITASQQKDAVANGMIPNAPYTPTTNGISINYCSNQEMEFTKEYDNFYHILPCGYKKVNQVQDFPLIYGYPKTDQDTDQANANLYLGIQNLQPGSNLSLLFQFKEGTEATFDELIPEESDFYWSYLSKDNQWLPFEVDAILKNTTEGYTRTGIVQLQTPYNMNKETTLFEGDYHWVRLAVIEKEEKSVQALPCLVSITAQAIQARFKIDEEDLAHFVEPKPLAKETIKRLAKSDSKVKKIDQPLPSFNGRMPEKDNDFYQRISERLNHRNRAVTVVDYERILLEAYPPVYRVKCLNHTKEGCEIAPGYVTIAVIPDIKRREVNPDFTPRFSLGDLREMNTFLREKTNFFVATYEDEKNKQGAYLNVVNPYFEEVKVNVTITFKAGKDIAFYTKKMKEDLKFFIAPWAKDESTDISFDRSLSRAGFIQFIEQQDYVDAIKELIIYHKGDLVVGDKIIPATSYSILTTASDHSIPAPTETNT